MNLRDLEMPQTHEGLIQTYRTYYHLFYIEMVRMSNTALPDYIDSYIQMLEAFSRKPYIPGNTQRVAIGVISLHSFGFRDFDKLSLLFDRIIPQTNLELVRFTSWCAGTLVHHPDATTSRYVSHLIERAVGWIRSYGRRARFLAAVNLLISIAKSAGDSTVVFLPVLEAASWQLLSNPSLQVLYDTAEFYKALTESLIRYGRSELYNYLSFFYELCVRLLSYGHFTKEYAALLLLGKFIMCNPDFYIRFIPEIWSLIDDTFQSEHTQIKALSFWVSCTLSTVDTKLYLDQICEESFEYVDEFIDDHPMEFNKGIEILLRKAKPEFEEKIDLLINYSRRMIETRHFNESFALLTMLTKKYTHRLNQIDQDLIIQLLSAPFSNEYKTFVVNICNALETPSGQICKAICDRVRKEINGPNPITTLEMISQLPGCVFAGQNDLVHLINHLSTHESSLARAAVPSALYNIAVSTNIIKFDDLIKKLLKLAIYDENLHVRYAILEVIHNNCSVQIAKPEYLKLLQVFVNDDAYTVRKITLKILGKLSKFNPIYVTSITRKALLDYFFILKNVPSIRQRTRIARILPDLVSACSNTIKAYSNSLIEIFFNTFENANPTRIINFMEANADKDLIIGLINSMSLLAPNDPETISKHIDQLIAPLCNYLIPGEQRNLILSILRFLEVLFKPPCSTVEVRTNAPKILSMLSTLLAGTRSRKQRIQILKVIGSIGVLEVHHKTKIQASDVLLNVDDSLARQFYHPNRDTEGEIDECILFKPNQIEQYNISVVISSLFAIFKDETKTDLFYDTIQALVQVLSNPRNFALGYFDDFVTRLLDVIAKSPKEQMRQYLPLYAELISKSSHNASPFIARTLEIMHEHFCSELSIYFLDVILAFLHAIKDGFSPYSSETICLLIILLDESKTCDIEVSKKVLAAFTIIGNFAIDQRYLIIPQICDAVVCAQSLPLVRVMALEALRVLVAQNNLFQFIGPIVRSVTCSILYNDEQTKEASKQLLAVLLKNKGYDFFIQIDQTSEDYSILSQLIQSLGDNKVENITATSLHLPLNVAQRNSSQKVFSEDTIIARAIMPNLGHGKHVEQWLQNFIIALISNSPSESIRACATLAISHQPLVYDLFNSAFHSCWNILQDKTKAIICESFKAILCATENYETVAREIIDLLVFMHMIQKPLDIPMESIVNACKRYGVPAFALKLQQEVFYKCVSEDTVAKMIDLYLQVGDWVDAVAFSNRYKDTVLNKTNSEIWIKLKMWDLAEKTYQDRYKKHNDIQSFNYYIQSLANLSKWQDVMSYFETFNSMKRHNKHCNVEHFAKAAFYLGKWEELDKVLSLSPKDSIQCAILSALNALHKENYDKASNFVEQGFSLLASQPIKFWEDEMRIHKDTMLAAQEMTEVQEMIEWVKSDQTKKKTIEAVWNERLKTAPRDFELWFGILGNRSKITGIVDESLIQFFQLHSESLGTKCHTSAFEVLVPDFDPNCSTSLERLCQIVARWNVGDKEQSLKDLDILIDQTTGNLRKRCNFYYAQWLLELDDCSSNISIAFNHLKEALVSKERNDSRQRLRAFSTGSIDAVPVSPRQSRNRWRGMLTLPSSIYQELVMDMLNIDILRKWAEVNGAMIVVDKANTEKYVINMITALYQCTQMDSSFPDAVQLLTAFFEFAHNENIYELTAEKMISKLDPKLLLHASPQILIQLSHPSKRVADFVKKIILDLLPIHYHGLIFSIFVLGDMSNSDRKQAASEVKHAFYKQCTDKEVYNEVILIRSSMLRAAVTIYEKAYQRFHDAASYLDNKEYDLMRKEIKKITVKDNNFQTINICEMNRHFYETYRDELIKLDTSLDNFAKTNSSIELNNVARLINEFCTILGNEVAKVKQIQLSSISSELCKKENFNIAVLGTYKPSVPITRIKYFVNQFSVYMSKQLPKDVVIVGEDGYFHRYLLKGHEDLRLDERIMQFFKLVNSYIRKESLYNSNTIQTTPVIPLSVQHGMVKWVTGTDTLKNLVESYRTLHNRNNMIEYDMINQKLNERQGGYDLLLPVQKLEIIKSIFESVPDTDIADFFWLKAENSEVWLKQIRTFAISTAMTSIVGYIIGLGDRHPSNLLINKITGKVIHIDFGDCFDKATYRQVLPEVVPFRLTRMMVRAMGATGVDGTFKNTFITTSSILRANRRVLMMDLAVFMHEPIADVEDMEVEIVGPDPSSQMTRTKSTTLLAAPFDEGKLYIEQSPEETTGMSNIEIRATIKQKLHGKEFGGNALTVEEQADKLIEIATNTYNLAKMYHGWCPFW